MRANIIKISLILLFLITASPLTFAELKAHFGEFGIQYLPNKQAYIDAYLGKTVMYIPKVFGYYEDDIYWDGKFNTEYIVKKVSGNDKKIKFDLIEKNEPANKVKFVFDIKYSLYSEEYSVTKYYTVPLLVVDALNNRIKSDTYIGKTYSTKKHSNAFRIDSIVMSSDFAKDFYPTPAYSIKNNINNTTFCLPIEDISLLEDIGHVYTNHMVKATYEVIGVSKAKSELPPYDMTYFHTVQNSIDSSVRTIPALNASEKVFSEDISGKYVSTLSKVERPSDSSNRYGETTVIEEEGITKFSYIDELIDIIIFASNSQFNFVLKNVSSNTIKVIWNEAVFVDSDGSTSKVMHVGTKYSEREGDQPATTIIKGAKIEDVAIPTKNVRYTDYKYISNEWVVDPMVPSEPNLKVDPIRLMLPITVKDVVNEYIFEFDIKYKYNYPDRLNL